MRDSKAPAWAIRLVWAFCAVGAAVAVYGIDWLVHRAADAFRAWTQ